MDPLCNPSCHTVFPLLSRPSNSFLCVSLSDGWMANIPERPAHLYFNSTDRQLSANKWIERKKERESATEKLECGRRRGGNEPAVEEQEKAVIELKLVFWVHEDSMRCADEWGGCWHFIRLQKMTSFPQIDSLASHSDVFPVPLLCDCQTGPVRNGQLLFFWFLGGNDSKCKIRFLKRRSNVTEKSPFEGSIQKVYVFQLLTMYFELFPELKEKPNGCLVVMGDCGWFLSWYGNIYRKLCHTHPLSNIRNHLDSKRKSKSNIGSILAHVLVPTNPWKKRYWAL